MYKQIGFIGGGKMAEALLKGFLEQKLFKPNQIFVSDILDERLDHLADTYKVHTIKGNKEVVAKTNLIIFAVKPQVFSEVISEISKPDDHFNNKLFISIVAGIKLEKLNLSDQVKTVRVMPNTPALIGQGMSAIVWGKNINDQDKEIVQKLFQAVGKTVEVAEDKINAVTALSGSGPAFVFRFMDALVKGGVAAGLDEQTALLLVQQTILGSAQLSLASINTLEGLIDMVSSPQGTTVAGRKVLESGEFAKIIKETIKAAKKRAEELSQ